MKNRFSVVEKDGRYHLYEGDKEYLTPCLFPLSSCDKGLMEAIARRLGENKPNVVMLYLNNNIAIRLYVDAFVEGTWAECKDIILAKMRK